MSDDKKEYIVREGRTFGVNALPAGESVWLTEDEAKPFLDLIELRVKPRKTEQAADTTDQSTVKETKGKK